MVGLSKTGIGLCLWVLFFAYSGICQAILPQNPCPTLLKVINAESGLPLSGIGFQYIKYRQKTNQYVPAENLTSDENGNICLENGWSDLDTLWVNHSLYQAAKFPIYRIRQQGYRIILKPHFDDFFPFVDLTELQQYDTLSMAVRSRTVSSYSLDGGLTVGDIWRRTGEVQVTRNLLGGGLPTLPGLGLNQAAIMVDGIPVNHGFSGNRSDYGGLLPTVGVVTCDILASPISFLEGASAQGGRLGYTIFRLKDYETARNGVHGAVQGRYFSQWKGLGEEAILEYNSDNIYAKTSAGYAQIGDINWGKKGIEAGRDWLTPQQLPIDGLQSDSLQPNAQSSLAIGSGFRRLEVNQGIMAKSIAGILWNVYGQLQYARIPQQTQTIAIYQSDSDGVPVWGGWQYTLRDRRMLAGGFELPIENALFDNLWVKVSQQRWRETSEFRRLGDTLRGNYFDRLDQLNLRLDFVKHILGKQTILYGLRYRQDHSQSRAIGKALSDGTPYLIQPWRPDGGGKMRQFGLYYHQLFELSPGAKAWLGASYDHTFLQVNYNRGSELSWLPFTYSLPNNALSGSAGLHVKAGNGWDWQVDASSGFRTLNIEDASIVYASKEGQPIAPNPVLSPAYILQMQGVIGHQQSYRDRVEGALFYRRILDGYSLGNTVWEGQDSVDFMGQYSAIQAFQNNIQLHQVGIRLGGSWPFGHHWVASGAFHSLYQWSVTMRNEGSFFPAFGSLALEWQQPKWSVKAYCLFATGATDRGAVMGWEGGGIVPGNGYGVPSLSVSYTPLKWLVLHLSAENLTDRRYRMAQSRFYEPGRNIGGGIRIQF